MTLAYSLPSTSDESRRVRLRGVAAARGRSAGAGARALKVARRRRFARNEVVFHRDDPGDSLHLINRGRFAIRVMTPLGDTATIAVRGPGESFGEMALVGGTRRSATVAALEDRRRSRSTSGEFAHLRRAAPGGQRSARSLPGQRGADAQRAAAGGALRAGRATGAAEAGRARGALPRRRRRARDHADAGGLAELAGAARPTVNQVLREEAGRRA